MMIDEILKNIREFYHSDKTRDLNYRLQQLKALKNAVIKYEAEIVKALKDDLRKPDFEIYTTEIGFVLQEIDFAIHHLKKWAKPKRVSVPMYLRPAAGYIFKEPYGVVLIIGTFNYPFQLTLVPLIGAIAAGNCAIVKASKRTPACARIICKILADAFSPDYIKCLLPAEISNTELISAGFDYIFFTGSSKTGSEVAKAAGSLLTPCTLELGGKSPVIVDSSANIVTAAKKIVWGKFLNCGQTCIAPDFVFVHNDVKVNLIEEIIKSIRLFFGVIPQESKDYGRLVDEDAFFRLKELLDKEYQNIIHGGQTDECGLYIEPTLLDIKSFDNPIMQDEIFGPILPILTYSDIKDVIKILRTKPKPLALYLFSQNKDLEKQIMRTLSFGGGGVNDVMNHNISPAMPFGGIGTSGIGQYHGKFSFKTFTHLKSVLIRNSDIEMDLMYPPYETEKTEKVRKFFLKN